MKRRTRTPGPRFSTNNFPFFPRIMSTTSRIFRSPHLSLPLSALAFIHAFDGDNGKVVLKVGALGVFLGLFQDFVNHLLQRAITKFGERASQAHSAKGFARR